MHRQAYRRQTGRCRLRRRCRKSRFTGIRSAAYHGNTGHTRIHIARRNIGNRRGAIGSGRKSALARRYQDHRAQNSPRRGNHVDVTGAGSAAAWILRNSGRVFIVVLTGIDDNPIRPAQTLPSWVRVSVPAGQVVVLVKLLLAIRRRPMPEVRLSNRRSARMNCAARMEVPGSANMRPPPPPFIGML